MVWEFDPKNKSNSYHYHLLYCPLLFALCSKETRVAIVDALFKMSIDVGKDVMHAKKR